MNYRRHRARDSLHTVSSKINSLLWQLDSAIELVEAAKARETA